MEKRKRSLGNARASAKALEEKVEAYFTACAQEDRHPTVTGLALALGLNDRRELSEWAAKDSKTGALLRRACSRVEEANLQAAYRRDSASGARFILQNGFGYTDKHDVGLSCEAIQVNITEE